MKSLQEQEHRLDLIKQVLIVKQIVESRNVRALHLDANTIAVAWLRLAARTLTRVLANAVLVRNAGLLAVGTVAARGDVSAHAPPAFAIGVLTFPLGVSMIASRARAAVDAA